MTKPCADCPFLKDGAIELADGRLLEIARGIVADDTMPFLCHKTVYSKHADGTVFEMEDGTTKYVPGSNDSVCAGSMVFLLKARAQNVAMRMGAALGMLAFKDLERWNDLVINPNEVFKDGEPSAPHESV